MNLNDEDREQLNEWLLSKSYSEILVLLALPRPEGMDIKTHLASLSRYYSRVMPDWIAQRRQHSLQTARSFQQSITESGQFDVATIEAVKQQAFETVLNPKADPGFLKAHLRTVLKLRDQQLLRNKLDLATAKAIQQERIDRVKSEGYNPFSSTETSLQGILKELASRSPWDPTTSLPLKDTPIPAPPLRDPLLEERQRLVALFAARAQQAQALPET
jgi:hypothetical protein